MAETVARLNDRLPPDERSEACALAGNYGEAGAINFFGAKHGLPKAISDHNSYYPFWGPRGPQRRSRRLRRRSSGTTLRGVWSGRSRRYGEMPLLYAGRERPAGLRMSRSEAAVLGRRGHASSTSTDEPARQVTVGRRRVREHRRDGGAGRAPARAVRIGLRFTRASGASEISDARGALCAPVAERWERPSWGTTSSRGCPACRSDNLPQTAHKTDCLVLPAMVFLAMV